MKSLHERLMNPTTISEAFLAAQEAGDLLVAIDLEIVKASGFDSKRWLEALNNIRDLVRGKEEDQ